MANLINLNGAAHDDLGIQEQAAKPSAMSRLKEKLTPSPENITIAKVYAERTGKCALGITKWLIGAGVTACACCYVLPGAIIVLSAGCVESARKENRTESKFIRFCASPITVGMQGGYQDYKAGRKGSEQQQTALREAKASKLAKKQGVNASAMANQITSNPNSANS